MNLKTIELRGLMSGDAAEAGGTLRYLADEEDAIGRGMTEAEDAEARAECHRRAAVLRRVSGALLSAAALEGMVGDANG